MMPSGLNKIYNTFSIIIKAFKTPMIFGTSLLLMLISCLSCSSVTTFYSHQYRRRRWHPLQCSCLENPMDGGAWRAVVHGVGKSRTWLSDFPFTFMHWRRRWHPTPVFLPGESQGRGSLVGCRLWGRTESDTTEATQQRPQQPSVE